MRATTTPSRACRIGRYFMDQLGFAPCASCALGAGSDCHCSYRLDRFTIHQRNAGATRGDELMLQAEQRFAKALRGLDMCWPVGERAAGSAYGGTAHAGVVRQRLS